MHVESIWELEIYQIYGKCKIFLMPVYMIFKYSKRFRYAPSFNNLSLEMILLPTQTLVLYLISDCNILWRMFDETNRCFIWFANKSTEWFDCRKISYQNSPDALTHRLWGDILIDMYFIQYYLLTRYHSGFFQQLPHQMAA